MWQKMFLNLCLGCFDINLSLFRKISDTTRQGWYSPSRQGPISSTMWLNYELIWMNFHTCRISKLVLIILNMNEAHEKWNIGVNQFIVHRRRQRTISIFMICSNRTICTTVVQLERVKNCNQMFYIVMPLRITYHILLSSRRNVHCSF